MAHGLACIAFDIKTGPREISRDGTRALLLKDDTQKIRLQEALQKLTHDTACRQKLAAAATSVNQDYDLASVMQLWDVALQTVLKAEAHCAV